MPATPPSGLIVLFFLLTAFRIKYPNCRLKKKTKFPLEKCCFLPNSGLQILALNCKASSIKLSYMQF